MHVASSIGDEITQHHAGIFINNFVGNGVLTKREGLMAESVTSDKALAIVPPGERDLLRAEILKRMILSLLSE